MSQETTFPGAVHVFTSLLLRGVIHALNWSEGMVLTHSRAILAASVVLVHQQTLCGLVAHIHQSCEGREQFPSPWSLCLLPSQSCWFYLMSAYSPPSCACREDVQVTGPQLDCRVHSHVLQGQAHRLAPGPHPLGQSLQPRERCSKYTVPREQLAVSAPLAGTQLPALAMEKSSRRASTCDAICADPLLIQESCRPGEGNP